jgi:glutamate-1-semialdehyde 2,1-aminomutase
VIDLSSSIAKPDFVREYLRLTPKSSTLYERAQKSLPDGNTRHTYLFRPRPLYIQKGDGCRIFDVDGNELFDFANNMGALILGHNNANVARAVKDAVEQSGCFAAPTRSEIELAEMMCEAIPCAETIRFTVTGTEATMTAIRAARAYSAREKIAKFEGHYHGTHDYAQVSTYPNLDRAGTPSSPTALPDSAGIPSNVVDSVIVLPWNNIHSCEKIIKEHKDELAGVILDPIANGSGIIPPKDGFLAALRECTETNDVLLIFDEVISGFRLAYGGAQEFYNVTPDMATYGKIIGGGYPAGAVAGRREIMQVFGSGGAEPKVRHYGTFNAQPIAMRAGTETLKQLKPELYEKIGNSARLIKTEIEKTLADEHIQGCVSAAGSLLYLIHFGIEDLTNIRDRRKEHRELVWQFGLGSICQGVYFVPSRSSNVSAAFSPKDIASAIEKMKTVLIAMKPLFESRQIS